MVYITPTLDLAQLDSFVLTDRNNQNFVGVWGPTEVKEKCRWVQVAVASIAMLWVGFLSRAELASSWGSTTTLELKGFRRSACFRVSFRGWLCFLEKGGSLLRSWSQAVDVTNRRI